MLLGVVSDTHGHVRNTRAAAMLLKSLEVDTVLHCGDVGSSEIPSLFAAWPSHFVLGNVDYDPEGVKQAIAAHPRLQFHDRFADLTLASRRIAVVHSDDFKRFRDAITSGLYDLVCYGHSHIAEHHREGNTLVLNPGALYRADPHSLAVVNLETMEVTSVPVER